MTDDEVLPHLRERLPDFTPTAEPERMPGGNLNVVWRVPGAEGSLIVKHAPPHIAADPSVPLDPSRLLIEARCLNALDPDGALAGLQSGAVRVPRLRDVDEEAFVVVMEDLGDRPSLGDWLRRADEETLRTAVPAFGADLGAFIGRLHAATHDRPAYATVFDNRPMQETRQAVQYGAVADLLARGGVSDAEALGGRAEALGEALLDPGRCLTMGDLWPSSVLVGEGGLGLIDWELAHYGRPLQDVAHWAAHLWMQRHRTPSPAVADAVAALGTSFRSAYREALGEVQGALWTDAERRDAAVHVGAEILVRAVGAFQDGYVYAGLAPDHPAVQEAVAAAARHIRAPTEHALFEA
jgi:aminoglycoside phosphotransferase (APT) family kinase protein